MPMRRSCGCSLTGGARSTEVASAIERLGSGHAVSLLFDD